MVSKQDAERMYVARSGKIATLSSRCKMRSWLRLQSYYDRLSGWATVPAGVTQVEELWQFLVVLDAIFMRKWTHMAAVVFAHEVGGSSLTLLRRARTSTWRWCAYPGKSSETSPRTRRAGDTGCLCNIRYNREGRKVDDALGSGSSRLFPVRNVGCSHVRANTDGRNAAGEVWMTK